jgi:hypothetical protein
MIDVEMVEHGVRGGSSVVAWRWAIQWPIGNCGCADKGMELMGWRME